MGYRITDVASQEFGALFTAFAHTAYRLETLQRYDVGYEDLPYRAFLEGAPRPHDPSKAKWTAMLRASVADGKVLQRVHVVVEPMTDYLRYELEWSYEPNVAAGEDIRVWPVRSDRWPGGLPQRDYWLFDSRDLWIMDYDDDGRFRYAEHVDDPAEIVRLAYWRDAALHSAYPYAEFMSRHQRTTRHGS